MIKILALTLLRTLLNKIKSVTGPKWFSVIADEATDVCNTEEIHVTTRDEYGLKARGFLHSLESFSTLLGLQLSHKLFSVAEQVSLVLQKKSLTIQDALSTVDTAKAYYSRIRTDDEFDHFYEGAMKDAEKHAIGKPELPQYRRRPSKLDDGAPPHQFPSAKAYFCHIYFEACELVSTELERRFDHQHIPSIVAIEHEGC